ncbi:MAG: hypothetical protein AAGA55_02260 [Planctomycetota bacterium]
MSTTHSTHPRPLVLSDPALLLCGVLLASAACQSREDRIKSRIGDLPTPEEVLAERDADGDGTLSLEEIDDGRPRANDRFERADQDGDGSVTLDELRQAYEQVRSRFGG